MGARRLSVEEAALLNDADPAVRDWARATFGGSAPANDSCDASDAASDDAASDAPFVEKLDVEPSGEGGAGGPPNGDVISVCVRLRPLSEREAASGGAAWRVKGNYVWEAEAEAEAERDGGDVTAYELPVRRAAGLARLRPAA